MGEGKAGSAREKWECPEAGKMREGQGEGKG